MAGSQALWQHLRRLVGPSRTEILMSRKLEIDWDATGTLRVCEGTSRAASTRALLDAAVIGSV
jgi:hypothetical protein